jgi:uncharacterized membrane protein YsdA (DUF1294 family)
MRKFHKGSHTNHTILFTLIIFPITIYFLKVNTNLTLWASIIIGANIVGALYILWDVIQSERKSVGVPSAMRVPNSILYILGLLGGSPILAIATLYNKKKASRIFRLDYCNNLIANNWTLVSPRQRDNRA